MRNWELDKCRFTACLMVVMLHVASTGWFIDPATTEWRLFNLADTMVRGCVPLFFMISGTLFLQKETLDIRKLYKKNLAHLIVLYVAWSILYEIVACILNSHFEPARFFLAVCKGHYHLWFIPAMIVAYLFLPIVHHTLHGQKIRTSYFLFLFGILTLLVVNTKLIPGLPAIIRTLLDKLDLSHVQYIGYMVWGYFLSRKHFGRQMRLPAILIYILCGLLTASANRWYSIDHGRAISWLYDYFSIPTFIQATAIFCFFQTLHVPEKDTETEKKHPCLSELSACTLGVYLLHPMVLETLTRQGLDVRTGNPVYKIPIVFAATITVCFAIILLIRRIILLRKLV